MDQEKIVNIVRNATEQIIHDLGYQLVKIAVEKEEAHLNRKAVVVYIDKPEGITISDCVIVSKKINPVLQSIESLDDSLILEVSSISSN